MARKQWELPIWDTIPKPWPRGREQRRQLTEVGLLADDIARYERVLRESRPSGLKRKLRKAVN